MNKYVKEMYLFIFRDSCKIYCSECYAVRQNILSDIIGLKI